MNKKFSLTVILLLTFWALIGKIYAQNVGCTLSGIVQDSLSGKSIIGASVVILNDTNLTIPPLRGAITNRFGFYSLPNLPAGEYFVYVRSLGYTSSIKEIRIKDTTKSIRLDFLLKEESVVLPDVIVSEKRGSEISNQVSVVHISPELIKNLPSMTGEVD